MAKYYHFVRDILYASGISMHSLGVISIKENLEICDRVTASSFCRRRLPVIMVRNQMTQRVKMATQFVEQGRILSSGTAVCRAVWLGTEIVVDVKRRGRQRPSGWPQTLRNFDI
ncbi:hypothetical protein HPB50_027190 [Hyalomma asiaticum]|uniref:Uncharacterized protein n=1 Tax=Hyalomma asiaticum TaxID=266040 RepID=A0ACB7TPU4_HYAAI|nr:hypothetical protein HPB50_027190 [Hyalomma asiaticum]